uniref:Uncharacterized protein n=1 Tax=Clastoptera arizonana TaxID=38151 RepID=A0A1B6D1U1_9HEMI
MRKLVARNLKFYHFNDIASFCFWTKQQEEKRKLEQSILKSVNRYKQKKAGEDDSLVSNQESMKCRKRICNTNRKRKTVSNTFDWCQKNQKLEEETFTSTKISPETKICSETKISPETNRCLKTKLPLETKICPENKITPETKLCPETEISPETKVCPETKMAEEINVCQKTNTVDGKYGQIEEHISNCLPAHISEKKIKISNEHFNMNSKFNYNFQYCLKCFSNPEVVKTKEMWPSIDTKTLMSKVKPPGNKEPGKKLQCTEDDLSLKTAKLEIPVHKIILGPPLPKQKGPSFPPGGKLRRKIKWGKIFLSTLLFTILGFVVICSMDVDEDCIEDEE